MKKLDLPSELSTEIHYLLGQTYEALNKNDKAVEQFTSAKELFEKYEPNNKALINFYLSLARI